MKVNKLIVMLFFCFGTFNAFCQNNDMFLDCAKESVLKESGYKAKKVDWSKNNPMEVTLNKKLIMKGYELAGLENIWFNDYKSSWKSKHFDIHLELWEFKNESLAALACTKLVNLIDSSSFFEKPPKKILLQGKFCIITSTASSNNNAQLNDFFSFIENGFSSCL